MQHLENRSAHTNVFSEQKGSLAESGYVNLSNLKDLEQHYTIFQGESRRVELNSLPNNKPQTCQNSGTKYGNLHAGPAELNFNIDILSNEVKFGNYNSNLVDGLEKYISPSTQSRGQDIDQRMLDT